MSDYGTTTIASGARSLSALIKELESQSYDFNEAETRFHIIDRILKECLGWPRNEFRLERPQGRQYSDYELGTPRKVIWEAKREGKTFELPANPAQNLFQDLPSVIALGGDVAEAISQVQDYCTKRGVEFAVATNGHQLVAFLASRRDGVAPLDGRCLVINTLEQFHTEFPILWQFLSPAGIAERRLYRRLTIGSEQAVPPKLSSRLANYPSVRYPSELQSSLRTVSELLITDLVETEEVEPQFYRECYCESGALSKHSLMSRKILSDRYTALFGRGETAPTVQPVAPNKNELAITPEVMAEAIAKRPIVLIGDVGVGKTSFLKHLMYVSAYEEFSRALYVYIDLGSQGALSANLRVFVLSQIETQLRDNYGVDIHAGSFIRGVYNLEVKRFEAGLYGPLKNSKPEEYQEKLLEFLSQKTDNQEEHARNSIDHIAKGRKQQVVIIVDNADQRDYSTQQEAYIIAQNLAVDWQSTVFIALRPQTFYHSKRSGAFSAYPHTIFTIAPPRADLVVEKRLTFALKIAQGELPLEKFEGVHLNLDNMANFLNVLIYSLKNNTELVEFISNITGGNIRNIIELVTSFIGSTNVNSERILQIYAEQGRYLIPTHEFWKQALLGNYSHFDPTSSIAMNVFDIRQADSRAHFLAPMILGYLDHSSVKKDKEGYVSCSDIIEEMQNWGFSALQAEDRLRDLNNKRLIEAPQRITFDEDDVGLIGKMPESFRISPVGAYHLRRWIGEFAYLEAMAFDTPIIGDEDFEALSEGLHTFAIDKRLKRATLFKRYLERKWNVSDLSPQYFDFRECLKMGEKSFTRVRAAVDRMSN